MDYVRALPKPLENKPATDAESKEIAAGRATVRNDRLRDLPLAQAGHRRRDL